MRILVKIGSNVLTPGGCLNESLIIRLAAEISALVKREHQCVIVTSGAVSTGKASVGPLDHISDEVTRKQVLAAIGQPKLMACYSGAFETHDFSCAQALLTRRNLSYPEERKTLQAFIEAALEAGTIPILNENDAVTKEELRNDFTDNDQLAALVTTLIKANKMIVLSDVPGFLRDCGDPASVVPVIEDIASYLELIDPSAGNGRGGMRSKLETARKVTREGTEMVIASGDREMAITGAVNGESVGTLFPAKL